MRTHVVSVNMAALAVAACINLTPTPEDYVAQNPSPESKWRAGNLFVKLKRGSNGRKGGSHSALCGYKVRRGNYFRGKKH